MNPLSDIDSKPYSFGQLGNPRDTDQCFDDLDAAIKAAGEHQQSSSWDSALAIYDNDSGWVLYIYFCGVLYKEA